MKALNKINKPKNYICYIKISLKNENIKAIYN